MNDGLTDDLNAQEQAKVDDAFARRFQFRGIVLEPFSFARQAAFQRLKIDEDCPAEAAAAILYLCTLGETPVNFTPGGVKVSGIDLIDLARGPLVSAFRQRVSEWATAQGIGNDSDIGQEAISLVEQIWEGARVSRFSPVEDASKGHNQGNLKTPPKSIRQKRRNTSQ